MEEEATAERVGQPESPPKLGYPLTGAGDAKFLTGLSTVLVASIQDAKDRIAHIEYVFCSQLYPHFQSDAASKRRRIDQLQGELDDNITLHKNLLELLRSKDSALRESEEKLNAAFSKLEACQTENAALLARIDQNLGTRPREIEDEDEGKLLERVESLTRQLEAEKAKRSRVTEAYKRLKSQHLYLRTKVGLCEENVVQENKSESGSEFATPLSPILQPGLEKITPDVFVAEFDINEVKEKASEDGRGGNLSSLSSGFRHVPKLVSVTGAKRPASSWRQTRTHQSRAGPDPHDDFLDTPLENIRENLNKDCNKEDLTNLIQKDTSMDSSDDETQDMNANHSPQNKQERCSLTLANKNSFKYVEPVRKKAERENLKGVECKQCRKFYDAVLPTADGKDAGSSKQNFRCEHLDGVSRHRYRYVPPMTPEGFWNIGFESEM